MPELPEVEVTRLGLVPHVTGRRIVCAVVRHHGLRWPIDPALPELLAGLTVTRLLRRGKYLLIECMPDASHPAGRLPDPTGGWLLIHLGMTGTLRVLETPVPPGPHDHVDFELADAGGAVVTLRYRDPRRFGAVLWHAGDEDALAEHPLLRNLGIEPFDARFNGDWMHTRTRGRSAAIKTVLLAGDIVVGVGNIFARKACSALASGPPPRPAASAGRAMRRWPRPSAPPWPMPSRAVAAPCAISSAPTARAAISSWKPSSTTAPACLAGCAAPRSARSCRASARRSTAQAASADEPAAAAAQTGWWSALQGISQGFRSRVCGRRWHPATLAAPAVATAWKVPPKWGSSLYRST